MRLHYRWLAILLITVGGCASIPMRTATRTATQTECPGWTRHAMANMIRAMDVCGKCDRCRRSSAVANMIRAMDNE